MSAEDLTSVDMPCHHAIGWFLQLVNWYLLHVRVLCTVHVLEPWSLQNPANPLSETPLHVVLYTQFMCLLASLCKTVVRGVGAITTIGIPAAGILFSVHIPYYSSTTFTYKLTPGLQATIMCIALAVQEKRWRSTHRRSSIFVHFCPQSRSNAVSLVLSPLRHHG